MTTLGPDRPPVNLRAVEAPAEPAMPGSGAQVLVVILPSLPPGTCPQCGAHVPGPSQSGCDVCKVYQCAQCRRWVPWACGAGDDDYERCDYCVAGEGPAPPALVADWHCCICRETETHLPVTEYDIGCEPRCNIWDHDLQPGALGVDCDGCDEVAAAEGAA